LLQGHVEIKKEEVTDMLLKDKKPKNKFNRGKGEKLKWIFQRSQSGSTAH